ncbi:rod-binding protein [Vibrio diazotrophicus]|nr:MULTISPECIES: rod-binding protein [Vibrio]MCF7362817.1 rod-binding protein [Vibrio sp. A1-b2]MCZ4372019.1 rod-binding protein [Vibrio diazotrophicus]
MTNPIIAIESAKAANAVGSVENISVNPNQVSGIADYAELNSVPLVQPFSSPSSHGTRTAQQVMTSSLNQNMASIYDEALVSAGDLSSLNFDDNTALQFDPTSLNSLKYHDDEDAALREVSKQFEAIFVQEMLKRMRTATEALGDEENPLSNNSNGMFQDLLDNQLAISVTKKSSFGLAELLYQQLSGQTVGSV